MKLRIASDERSPEPAPELVASSNLANAGDQRRASPEPYRAGDGIGTPYGNVVFRGPGDDGFLHVQSRTTDYRVPTHLGNDRDAIRGWVIRSVEQGHIDRADLYPGASSAPSRADAPREPSRSRNEPYQAGDGIGTPYGNLVYRGLGVDGYLHVQSRTTDYRVPTHLGSDRDAIRSWAIRSVEEGAIDRTRLYPGESATPARPESPSRSQGEPYRAGDGIGTPYGNLVFKGPGDDGYLHVQTRTTDYRVPTHVGDDRDAVRAWAIRSVEQGHIDRADLYRTDQDARGTVQRSEIPAPVASPYADGFVYSSQLNDRVSGDFPRDANGNATMPADWNNNLWLRNEVGIQNRETDDQLLARFNTELQLASHYNPVANALLDHFVANTGQTFNSPPGSAWSELIRNDSEGRRIGDTISARIYDIAEAQYAHTGRVDLETIRVPLTPEDRAVWGNKPQSPAFGAFGSTDGLQVEIQNARFDPATKQLTGNARITIIDTFGLSNSDWDSPGQVAMWLLQHQRGYQPFVHTVQYDVPLNWTVRSQRPFGAGDRPTE
ncbi:MAG: hypothetical protein E6Q50_08645 [Lysobacter sp.]|nr:MAG: hypothetical protein E6Q50_08645 [Lysobacter sp.]